MLSVLINKEVRNILKKSDIQFIEKEIALWKNSTRRILQIKGHLYYSNEHDILTRTRTMIGEDGKLEEVKNLPNNRIIDNQYAKLVNQKANYLLGQPFAIESENEQYVKLLKQIFNKQFMRTLKNGGKAALNSGIAWIYPYYNSIGQLCFRLFPGYEILPFWLDSEHTILDAAVRVYLTIEYDNGTPVVVEKAELYNKCGIHKFILKNGTLIAEKNPYYCYMTVKNEYNQKQYFNWEKVPFIALKYNEQEMPLLKKVKSLQDGINVMLSDFENNMQEDARNTILVLKNYDGTNLGEFRKNLSTYGAVKVRYDGEAKGGVETLEITINAENYKSILELFKKALIENGMGYDAKSDRLLGNPNQMNIQSMYTDIDLDANDMETELQAAFEEILWFVNAHIANMGKGDFERESVEIIFNRDMIMNETEAIKNCQASVGILSDKTIIAQHPWVDNPQQEIERLQKQKKQEQYDPFTQPLKDGDTNEKQ